MANYIELEDHQLIHRIGLGDRDALEELYGRYSTSVYSLARYMLRHEALAEEAAQEVFLNIWLKANSYNSDRGEARAWLMSVAHHKIVDIIRARRRSVATSEPKDYDALDLVPSTQRPTDEEAVINLDRGHVRAALERLPQAQREVIELAYYQGYSQSEIAEKLLQPLGTVKTRVRLAMQKLRLDLEEDVSD